MPQPLPAGWCDCNLANSYAATGTVAILCVPIGFAPLPSGIRGKIGDWELIDNSFASGTFCPPGQAAGKREVLALNSALAIGPTVVWTDNFGCSSTIKGWSPFFTWTDTVSHLRLGMTIELINALDPNPHFAIDYIVRFHWFADEFTTRVTTFAGLTGPTQYMQPGGTFGGTQHPGMTPVDLGGAIGNIAFGATVRNQGVNPELQVKLRGLGATDTTINTTGLNNSGVLRGLGSGNVDGYFAGSDTAKTESVMANYILLESAEVTKFGGADIGSEVVNADSAVHTSPYSETLAWTDASWNLPGMGHSPIRSMSIQAGWAAAQNPVLPSDDRTIVANLDPPQGSGDYLPVGISVAPQVEVHRPGGIIPSNWVASDGRITVTETMAETVIQVHAEGAYIERTFAGTANWMNRVGLGTGGTGHADFGIEEYEVYRHNYGPWGATGEDAWAWGTYAFLGYEIEAPGDATLALIAAGLYLGITDTHETSLVDRTANYVADLTAYDATYALNVREGTHAGRVDLLFPAEEQPFYHGRVGALRMSGFKVGTYRIKALRLEATGQAYLKICWGKQVQRSDYSSLVAAVNGAFVFGNWPDQAYKDDETGDYGGGIRYINPLTGSGSGLNLDNQKSISDFVLLLNKMEGWTATYSQAMHDARMKDAQGNEFPVELAQFIKPVVPYQRLTPGATFQPDCAIVCGQVQIANAVNFSIPWRLPLWGSLEGQGKTDGLRADSGVAVEAYRLDTGAVVATGVTDEDGFACVAPVPANGVVSVSLREAT